MQRFIEDVFLASFFNQLAKVHNTDVCRNVFYNRQVMRNEHVCKTHFLLQIHKKVQNLCLNGNVQSGNRFVTNDELWVDGQCASNNNTLTTTAVEFVWVLVVGTHWQTYQIHQFFNSCSSFFSCFVNFVKFERFFDNLTDCHTWVERSVWVLEDDLHILTHLTHFIVREVVDVHAIVKNVAGCCFVQTKDNTAQCGFTTTGFTYDTKCFTFVDCKVNIINSVKEACWNSKIFFETFGFNKYLVFHYFSSLLKRSKWHINLWPSPLTVGCCVLQISWQ